MWIVARHGLFVTIFFCSTVATHNFFHYLSSTTSLDLFSILQLPCRRRSLTRATCFLSVVLIIEEALLLVELALFKELVVGIVHKLVLMLLLFFIEGAQSRRLLFQEKLLLGSVQIRDHDLFET
jgi:hypothetical protein